MGKKKEKVQSKSPPRKGAKDVTTKAIKKSVAAKKPTVTKTKTSASVKKKIGSHKKVGSRKFLLKIPHHAPGRLFEGVACPSASGRDPTSAKNQNL